MASPCLSWQSSESRCLQRLKTTASRTEGEANNDPSDQTMTPGPELGHPGIIAYSYCQEVLTPLLGKSEMRTQHGFSGCYRIWCKIRDFSWSRHALRVLMTFVVCFGSLGQTDKVAHQFMWDSYQSKHWNCATCVKRSVCVWMMLFCCWIIENYWDISCQVYK